MQYNFKRHEEKYLVSKEQGVALKEVFSAHMEPDRFDNYLVQNLYYDTLNWDIIRSSLNKPLYKEKMRLRCYDIPDANSTVFLELKKKFKGTVYKSRVSFPFNELSYRCVQDIAANGDSPVSRELHFYMQRNAVLPRTYIAYRRSAFSGENELRVTFDTEIRYRLNRLDFQNPDEGYLILPQNTMLMEIKTLGGMPLWLARMLSEHGIFPASFSKYGKCYSSFIAPAAFQQTLIHPAAFHPAAFDLAALKTEEKLSA